MKIQAVFFLCLFHLLILDNNAQNIKLPVTNYTNKEYGRGHQAVNYAIILDNRDIVYTGNANGILEYDGADWNFIRVRLGAYVTSFSKDSQGTIFVGSQNEFGFLAPDRTGSMNYYSLSDSLPEDDRFFTTIWKTYVLENRVFFQADENIFIYENGGINVIYPETSFHTSFILNNKFYVRERLKGLIDYTSGEPVPVPGGDYFANLGIFAMLPLENSDKIFIATQEQGFFILDPNDHQNPIEAVRTENDPFIIQAGIMGGISLEDGNFAFNTINEGIIITDQAGRILNIINKSSGLGVNDVKNMYQDRNKNLWCALDNGISRIDYASPISFYKEESGILGTIHTIIRYHNQILLGTTNGLFVQKKRAGLTESIEFSPFENFSHQVWDLKEIDGALLAGTNSGLYLIFNNTVRSISGMNAFTMYYKRDRNLLFVGGSHGLSVFQTKPSWKLLKNFDDIHEDIKLIAENKNSFYNGTELWLGTSLQGTIKVIIHNDMSHETFKYYGEFDGLNEDWVLPFTSGDSVVFGTRTGIFCFNDEELIKLSLPDSLRNDQEFTRGFFEGMPFYNHSIITPVSFICDDPERIWIVIDNEIGYILRDQPDSIIMQPFKGIDMGKINYIYPDGEELYWIAADDGVIRYELDHKKDFSQTFNVLIRRVGLPGDSITFYGTFYQSSDDPVIPLRVVPEQPEGFMFNLPFSLNDLRFHFAAPFFDDEQKNLFSIKLDGYDNEFSPWTSQNNMNYTNLHEGAYTLLVKAKNVYGRESEPAFFSFSINPPWFRTIWAYIGYAIIFLLIIYLSIQISIIRLKRKNERLEQIVRERTAEIRAKNIELERQKKEITDSIHYALRIQHAVLPALDTIREKIPEYFILLKPRDIVSGDFYWLSDTGRKIVIVAADCTGHGVPGAFMSMLGVSFLNKIVNEDKITQASTIINELRDDVIRSLQQTGKEGEQKDGMDMGLCVIDFDQMTMEFAGAHNPLYFIRDNELNETKADRMPVAHYENLTEFTSHKIRLKKGDCFYLLSDGYADQFGGPEGKKFKYKTLKELLLSIQDKPMNEQKELLDQTYHNWTAGPDPEGKSYEQVDDILIVGVKI
jgi:serine phosphatase RsbU (regulator of sigma subunit)